MSFLNGFSQCWFPSDICQVNWDAWAAVGTFLAAYLALRIALGEQRRRRQESLDRALGMTTLLVEEIDDWLDNIRTLVHHVDKRHAVAIVESFEPEGGNILRVPPLIQKNLHRIHELDAPARELSIAVACVMDANRMKSKVRNAFKEGATDRDVVLDLFRSHLGTAGLSLVKASNQMNELIFSPPKKRSWWKWLLIG